MSTLKKKAGRWGSGERRKQGGEDGERRKQGGEDGERRKQGGGEWGEGEVTWF